MVLKFFPKYLSDIWLNIKVNNYHENWAKNIYMKIYKILCIKKYY